MLSFDEIANYSTSAFNKLVKDAIRKKAFSELVKQQKAHSKGKEIVYRDLNLQNYLKKDSPLNNEEKRFLFAARTRGLNVKNNFKQGNPDLKCRLCRNHTEDQQSLLTCAALNKDQAPSEAQYRDIFSDRTDKLAKITRLLRTKYEEFTFHVNRQQSCSATAVVNVDDIVNDDNIVNVDNSVEMG